MTPATGAGSISTGGRYTPPATLPNPNTVTVTATTTASPATSGSVTLTILNPYPTLASVNPTNIPVGSFAITVNGSGFVPGAQVISGGTPMATTYVSSTRLTAAGVSFPMQAGWKIPLVVKNPDPGSATSTDVIKCASPKCARA